MLTPMGELLVWCIGVEVSVLGGLWLTRPRHRKIRNYSGTDPWWKPIPHSNPDFPGYADQAWWSRPKDATGDWTAKDDAELEAYLRKNR